jgi:Amt family ammonium transporter
MHPPTGSSKWCSWRPPPRSSLQRSERVRVWPFLLFSAVLTGIIYPITGAWQWDGGSLSELGFSDFAGSTLVHSVGGWAALAGAILLGARSGKFGPGGQVYPMLGSSLPLATLGTMILWLGWFGFNGGSQLAMGSAADAVAIANIYVNTNLAAAGGVLASMALTQVLYRKIDLTMVLNGAIARLVSITAEPLTPSPGLAILIGAAGGVLAVFAVPLLYRLKIDDVVGAIPAHLVAGIWGTIAVSISNPTTSFTTQLVGIVAIGAFASLASLIVLVGTQGDDRHPSHRGGRAHRYRPGGARHRGLPGVRAQPRPLNARAILDRWPVHPPMPGRDPFLPGILRWLKQLARRC